MRNKILATFITLFSPVLFASQTDIYGTQGLKLVEDSADNRVNKLANGVCSINDFDGNGCCSGFYIAEDKVMTNYHCLDCVSPKASAYPMRYGFWFGTMGTNDFDVINASPELFSKVKIEVKAKTDEAKGVVVDYAQIEKILAGSDAQDFLILKVKKTKLKPRVNKLTDMLPYKGQKLMTIGYPANSPFPGKKVFDNTSECKVQDARVANFQGRSVNFGHQCDTTGGSSGSPIFDAFSGKVLGIHWGGGAKFEDPENPTWKESQNHAVPMAEIIQYLKDNSPELFESLAIQ